MSRHRIIQRSGNGFSVDSHVFKNPLRLDTQNVISRTSSYEADTLDDRVKPGIDRPCCSADQAQNTQ